MARVTIEDCILKIENPFDLVLLAAQRVNEITAGAPLTVDRDNDKNSVVALREIAESTISTGKLKENLTRSLQKHAESEEETPLLDEMLSEESHWLHGTESGNMKEEIKEDVLSVTDDLDGDMQEIDADTDDSDVLDVDAASD